MLIFVENVRLQMWDFVATEVDYGTVSQQDLPDYRAHHQSIFQTNH